MVDKTYKEKRQDTHTDFQIKKHELTLKHVKEVERLKKECSKEEYEEKVEKFKQKTRKEKEKLFDELNKILSKIKKTKK